ncbi:MAG TPA: patatin-like phospholipase family protein [Acidimicrobiales bacterium]|jgi:NTE family protein|nr:patatin-like phospholipase family protein [Acidimicrobiales bacterium]
MPNADLVLEGGGVKGLGLIGAVERFMHAGYTFQRVAGTSAGSILAAFVAAGIDTDALSSVMNRLDYRRVPDRGRPGLPMVSEAVSLLHDGGAYKGDYLRDFVHHELQKLGVTTFGDLRLSDPEADKNQQPYQQYKLVVMATDITRGRLLRLPWDYPMLHLDPDEQLVADAVRASSSIPLFFDPVTISDGTTGEQRTLVDGGVLSSFPVEIFDRTDGAAPRWPTFGIKILPDLPGGSAQLLPNIALPALRVSQLLPAAHLLEQVVATAIVGHDQTYLERPCVSRRIISVDTSGIGIVEFDASKKKREAIVAKGDAAAGQFLQGWSWDRYKKECGGAPDASDRDGAT